MSNPQLSAEQRQHWVKALMTARRQVGQAKRAPDIEAEKVARQAVHAAKLALGERGAVWWTDRSPDFNRMRVQRTPYAEWAQSLSKPT